MYRCTNGESVSCIRIISWNVQHINENINCTDAEELKETVNDLLRGQMHVFRNG